MKVVVQRVMDAKVEVNEKAVGSINHGLLVLVGFTTFDDKSKIDYIVNKIINLRIFDDDSGIMNKSVLDVSGEVLSISQFTLYANTKEGNRPSYIDALNGEDAIKLYDLFNTELSKYIHVEQGVFGEHMKVSFTNDGPITIIIEK